MPRDVKAAQRSSRKESGMQLGMIGLGRMGANMVRRLLKGGHQCVVFDRSPKAVEDLVAEKATGAADLRDLVKKLRQAAGDLADGPGGSGGPRPSPISCRYLEAGDILIDGGNSYYVDDIRRAKELAPKGIHYVDVGTSGGVWGLERGYCMMIGGETEVVEASRSDLPDAGARSGRYSAHAGTREARRHRRTGLPALRPQRRRTLRQDGAQRNRVRRDGGIRRGPGCSARRQCRQAAQHESTRRPRRCAIPSTTSTISIFATSPRCGGAAA